MLCILFGSLHCIARAVFVLMFGGLHEMDHSYNTHIKNSGLFIYDHQNKSTYRTRVVLDCKVKLLMKGNFKRSTVYTQFDKNHLNKSKLEHKVKNF
jgi:hypothetical protein